MPTLSHALIVEVPLQGLSFTVTFDYLRSSPGGVVEGGRPLTPPEPEGIEIYHIYTAEDLMTVFSHFPTQEHLEAALSVAILEALKE